MLQIAVKDLHRPAYLHCSARILKGGTVLTNLKKDFQGNTK